MTTTPFSRNDTFSHPFNFNILFISSLIRLVLLLLRSYRGVIPLNGLLLEFSLATNVTSNNHLCVVSKSSLLSTNEITRIDEAIEKCILLVKEAKKTLNEIPIAIRA